MISTVSVLALQGMGGWLGTEGSQAGPGGIKEGTEEPFKGSKVAGQQCCP